MGGRCYKVVWGVRECDKVREGLPKIVIVYGHMKALVRRLVEGNVTWCDYWGNRVWYRCLVWPSSLWATMESYNTPFTTVTTPSWALSRFATAISPLECFERLQSRNQTNQGIIDPPASPPIIYFHYYLHYWPGHQKSSRWEQLLKEVIGRREKSIKICVKILSSSACVDTEIWFEIRRP